MAAQSLDAGLSTPPAGLGHDPKDLRGRLAVLHGSPHPQCILLMKVPRILTHISMLELLVSAFSAFRHVETQSISGLVR